MILNIIDNLLAIRKLFKKIKKNFFQIIFYFIKTLTKRQIF